MIEPRPELKKLSTVVYLLLLAGGIVLFLMVFGPARFSSVSTGPAGAVGATTSFVQETSAPKVIASAFATALITVSLFELLKLGLQFAFYYGSTRRAINEFFGEKSTEYTSEGQIVLQSDDLSTLPSLLAGRERALEDQPANRFYKARLWINRFDTEGARAIVKMFRDLGFAPPKLTFAPPPKSTAPSQHTTVDATSPAPGDAPAPFKVIMGLGFTTEATALVRDNFSEWLRLDKGNKGDAIQVLEKLLPRGWKERLDGGPESNDGFVSLSPKRWTIESWLARDPAVRDYAVILRHTRGASGGHPACVYFWIAGFTERGTAAGGRYLADNWSRLWKAHVKQTPWKSSSDRDSRRGLGDFLICIEGPSHGEDSNDHWSQVSDFAITPALLDRESIKSKWRDRFHDAG